MNERFYKASFGLAAVSAALHVFGYGLPLAAEPFYFALGLVILWRVAVLLALALGLVWVLPTTDSPWERRARVALILMLGATVVGVSYSTPGLSDPSEDGLWLAMSTLLVAVGAATIGIHSRLLAAILGMAIYTLPLALLCALGIGSESTISRVAILLGTQALLIHVVLAWKHDRKEVLP